MDRKKFEQYMELKEEIEYRALEVYEIYSKIFYPAAPRPATLYWMMSSIEPEYDNNTIWRVYFQSIHRDDVDSMLLDYIFEEDPEAKIQADYEETQRIEAEKKKEKEKGYEEHLEELDRKTYLRLMEKYKDKWNLDIGFST